MGELIANRTLYANVNGEVVEILIQFEKPFKIDAGDWCCDYLITSLVLGLRQSGQAVGIDAVQAIILALQSVGLFLDTLDFDMAISRQMFLVGTTPDQRWLGDHFPRRIDVKHGLSDLLTRLERAQA